MKTFLRIVLLITGIHASRAQVVSINEAIDYALKNNASVRAASYEIETQRQLRKTSFDLPKTEVTLLFGQYNSYARGDNNITVSQSIPIAALGSQRSLNRSRVASAELNKARTENELVFQVKQVYHQLEFIKSKRKLLLLQDSLFERFHRSATLRYKTGETSLLEQSTAEMQRDESKNDLLQVASEIMALRTQLKALLNSKDLPDTATDTLAQLALDVSPDPAVLETNPSLAYSRKQIDIANGEKKVAAARLAPDLLVGFFNQTLIGTLDPESGTPATGTTRFTGFQAGISIPLWFAPHQGRVKAAEYTKLAAQSYYEQQQSDLQAQFQQAVQQHETGKMKLEYYRTTALPNADLVLRQASTSFRAGEAGYVEYLLGVRNVIDIRKRYLEALNDFNQTLIFLEFLMGNR